MKNGNSSFILKKKYYQMFICFMMVCIITLLIIWGYNYWPKSSLITYYIDASIIKYENDILTVKGLPFNHDFLRGTYYIQITDDIVLTDWETKNNLDLGALNNYKYVTLLYTGLEQNITDKKYLKGVNQVYCNVESRCKISK